MNQDCCRVQYGSCGRSCLHGTYQHCRYRKTMAKVKVFPSHAGVWNNGACTIEQKLKESLFPRSSPLSDFPQSVRKFRRWCPSSIRGTYISSVLSSTTTAIDRRYLLWYRHHHHHHHSKTGIVRKNISLFLSAYGWLSSSSSSSRSFLESELKRISVW